MFDIRIVSVELPNMTFESDSSTNNRVPAAVWIFWTLFITVAGLYFLGYRLFHREFAYLQTVILALTLLAVLWYTIETRRMQKAVAAQVQLSVRQVNLSVLPFFVAYVGDILVENERDRYIEALELENIGNGVALNVKIDSLDIDLGGDMRQIYPGAYLSFDPLMSVPKRDKVPAKHVSFVSKEQENNRIPQLDWMHHLKPPRAAKDYEMNIRFMDVLGNRYVQIIHIGKSGSWPDIVKPDEISTENDYPEIDLVGPFTHSPLREITSKRRRDYLTRR
jgi:hypothetical protein